MYIILAVGILGILFAILAMQTGRVQTIIAHNLAEKLSQKTNRKVRIGKVKYSVLYNKLRITDVFIQDERLDTLLYIKKMEARIQGVNLVSNNFRLQSIDLEKPYVKIISYNDSVMNILSFIDALGEDSTDSIAKKESSYFFTIPDIKIKDGRFAYQSYDKENILFGMNYGDLDFKKVNADISNLRNVGDTIKMNIHNLSTDEKCGLEVKNTTTKFLYVNGLLQFDNVFVKTRYSRLNAQHLKFIHPNEKNAWSNFIHKMKLDYLIKRSRINLGELAYFNSNFLGYHATATVATHATGTIDNFLCKNTNARIYDNTIIKGDVLMHGLPNILDTFFEGKVKYFQTTLEDLSKVKIPFYSKQYLKFPPHLDSLGLIKYKGSYTGFLSDFVLYGKFESEHGKILTDISIKNNIENKKINLNGKIITQSLDIGKILNSNKLGTVSMDIDVVNGFSDTKQAIVKGIIENIDLYNYPYKNINIDALLTEDKFNGSLKMKDKNIDFDFSGEIDRTTEIPQTNFKLQVNHANLAKLHLNQLTLDSISQLSFKMEAMSNGGEIDDITGSVKIDDLKYKNSLGEISPTSIIIKSIKKDSIKSLEVISDIMDINLNGNFNFSKLKYLPSKILSNYINFFTPNLEDSVKNEKGDLLIVFKDINPILKLLAPKYRISNYSTISGQYIVDSINSLSLDLCAEKISISGRKLYDVSFQMTGTDSLRSRLNIERLRLAKNFSLYNLDLNSNIAQNKAYTKLKWDNKQPQKYLGNLSMNTEFISYDNGKKSIINEIQPSTFFIAGEDWHFNNSKVIIDSNNWVIDKLKVFNNDSEFAELAGIITSQGKDMIYLELKQFDMKHFLEIMGLDASRLSGKISGINEYKKVNNKYTFISDMEIPKLLLGNKPIGTLQLHSELKENNQTLTTNLSLTNDDTTRISLIGNYTLKKDKLDFNLNLNKLDLKEGQTILKKYISKLNGVATGTVSIKGSSKKPLANGHVYIDIPLIEVAQTGVPYHISDTLNIKNNNININNLYIIDSNNKKATLNGQFVSNFGKIPYINLTMDAKNIQLLNNTYSPLAYGNTKATTHFSANGFLNDIYVKGHLSTDKYSKIIIPMNEASDIDDNEFISFINPIDSLNFIKSKDIDDDMTTEGKSPLSYDVDVRISPSTEIQVLFESKSGSTIKSKGQANLSIMKSKYDNQLIVGDYKVSQGTFFYSFNGIINKKFELEKGGTIKWDGTPEDAFLNLNAVYKLKTAITPLLSNQIGENNSRIIQTPILCKIHITGQLDDPKLTFAIEFPNLDSTTKGNIKSVLQTTDITKQVLSLLVFNKFIQPEFIPEQNQTSISTDALTVTTSELLSSQISNILSQLSNDINIGFIYKPGDELTKEEVGLALSTEFLQNRVSISGNLGFSSDIDNNNRLNDFVGDFDFDVKIDKTGKLRMRAFSHARDNLYYYENNKNIQGVGIIYREEFNTFKELLKRYRILF